MRTLQAILNNFTVVIRQLSTFSVFQLMHSYLLFLGSCFRLGKNPHLDFTKMAQKYGDVFSLMLGNRLVVVLNGFNAIEEALIKQSTAFAGRPQLHTFKLANRTDSSITLTDYSPRWRLSRKIGVSAIQNFVKDKDTLGQKLLQESQRLVHCLKQQKGKLVDVHLPLQCATSNIITDALFGVSWSYSNKAVHNMLQLAHNFRVAITACSHVDFLPLLKHLPSKALSDLTAAVKSVLDVISQLYAKNTETYVGGQVRNIADSIIKVVEKETEKERENRPQGEDTLSMAPLLSDEQIIRVLGDLFGAGFDTSAITLHWSLAYLTKYPEIQTQIQEELDLVIGRERLPTLQDMPSLPFFQAAVYELFRVTSIAPLSVLRSTTVETNIRDFTIPKDTVVMVNLWSVHRDPEIWKDPDVFDPRRFLDGAGQVIDPKFFRGFMPFSCGRRKCPGDVLATKQVSVLLAALLHSFRFTQDGLPADYKGINLQGEFGLTLVPQKFYVKLEERN